MKKHEKVLENEQVQEIVPPTPKQVAEISGELAKCANIYLNELDQFIKHKLRVKFYLRYCDDFIIVHKDKEYLIDLIPQIRQFLKSELRLKLHPKKIILRKLSQGVDFLGYVALPYHRVLRTKTKRRMFKKIDKKVKLYKSGLITKDSLNQTHQSYLGLLKHCDSYKIVKKIDSIIEML